MDDKAFELMEKMYTEMQNGFKKVDKDIQKIQLDIENNIKPKLDALFEGQQQHTEILQRIENEVARHEEVILKRIK